MQEKSLMKKTNLIHILFVISINAMVLLIVLRYGVLFTIVSMMFSAILSYVLVYRKRILERIFLARKIEIGKTIFALVVAAVLEIIFAKGFYIQLCEMLGTMNSSVMEFFASMTLLIVGIFSFSAIFTVIYVVVNCFWKAKKNIEE